VFGPAGGPPLVALYGYTFTPGAPSTLTLAWHALAPVPADYTLFIHARDAQGTLIAQRDAPPQSGAYPTTLWAPGEYILDPHPLDLPPGDFTLSLGLYLPETGERLVTAEGADAVELRLTVE
jgi:hypothetical protein